MTEQQEYEAQGLAWTHVHHTDNTETLRSDRLSLTCRAIEGPGGLVALLDEEGMLPRGTEVALYDKLRANKGFLLPHLQVALSEDNERSVYGTALRRRGALHADWLLGQEHRHAGCRPQGAASELLPAPGGPSVPQSSSPRVLPACDPSLGLPFPTDRPPGNALSDPHLLVPIALPQGFAAWLPTRSRRLRLRFLPTWPPSAAPLASRTPCRSGGQASP